MRPDWLNDMPSAWTSVPFGSIFTQSKRKNSRLQRDFVLSVMKDRGVIPYTEKGNVGNKVSEDLSGYKLVDKGDFVLNSMNLYMGSVGVSEYDGVTSTAYIVCKPKENVFAGYYNYLIQFKGFQEYVGFLGKGIMEIREAVRWTALKSVFVPLPDLPTQRAIAYFLDRETARIDSLIEKKQRLVELLGKKTKSANELFFLNAEATETQPLHRLYRVVTGKTPSRNEEDNFSDEEGLLWATPANLGFLAPIETTKEYLTEKGHEGQPIVEAGTVLLNGIGASVGKIGIAGTRLSFNQQIHALIAKKKVLVDRFLFFQLLTLKEQLVLLANSTTLPILNSERLGRLELQIIDFDRQQRHCANMDMLIQHEEVTSQKVNASIDRLKEYRSALITSAVTGQIDVSTYARSGTTARQLDAIQLEMN